MTAIGHQNQNIEIVRIFFLLYYICGQASKSFISCQFICTLCIMGPTLIHLCIRFYLINSVCRVKKKNICLVNFEFAAIRQLYSFVNFKLQSVKSFLSTGTISNDTVDSEFGQMQIISMPSSAINGILNKVNLNTVVKIVDPSFNNNCVDAYIVPSTRSKIHLFSFCRVNSNTQMVIQRAHQNTFCYNIQNSLYQ